MDHFTIEGVAPVNMADVCSAVTESESKLLKPPLPPPPLHFFVTCVGLSMCTWHVLHVHHGVNFCKYVFFLFVV